MSRIAYVNGRYVPQSEASVNVEDRGYQFADGVYEVLYLTGGRFLDEDLHMRRLERSLREISITPPMGRAAMLHVIREVTRRNRLRDGLAYMQVTRGVARREHAFPTRPIPAAMVVTCRRTPPYPKDAEAWAGTAISAPDQRWERCDIKSTGLLPNVLAKQAARQAGAYEAILIDRDGMVTEGASTTVWVVDSAGVLRTRVLSHAILPGCTRASLLDQMAGAGLQGEEGGGERDRPAHGAGNLPHQRHILRQADHPPGRRAGGGRHGRAGHPAVVRLVRGTRRRDGQRTPISQCS